MKNFDICIQKNSPTQTRPKSPKLDPKIPKVSENFSQINPSPNQTQKYGIFDGFWVILDNNKF
jgi:hypothetical protein